MERPTSEMPTVVYVLLALFLLPMVLIVVPMLSAAYEYARPILKQVGVNAP